MPHRQLDTTKLLPFDAPSILRRIDPTLAADLQGYLETLERLEGVVHFCAGLGRQNGTTDSVADAADRRRSLRAGLAEFASLDEAAMVDTNTRGTAAPKMLSLDDPRLHVVRLLRHANVHLAVSRVQKTSRQASWNDQDFTFWVYHSPDIGISIRQTEQAQKYHGADMSKMVAWIQTEQMEWGLDHLVCKTAELYGRALIGVCGK